MKEGGDGLIGWVEGASEGPLLLCFGGVHGNEPAGVRALEAMVDTVRARSGVMTGDLVAVVGNRSALAAGQRFIAYDLNRAWTPEFLGALESRGDGASADGAIGATNSRRDGTPAREDLEVLRVQGILAEVAARRRGPVYVLDLHSTSGRGGTFTSTDDRPGHRAFAREIPLPMVLGLDDHLRGTLLSHLNRLGYTTVLCECGQHEEAQAATRAVAAIWLAIRAAGLLGDSDAPEARRAFEMLRNLTGHLPGYLETVYRHPVEERDDYATRPGWRNFQRVQAGDVVGDDRNGEVAAPCSGMLLMPLYQRLGEDGFFVVRDLAAIRG
ncbi:MAG: hypothetical protein F4187_00860 [Gemmatimonadetes bacterium]|nr:hypothetical protein [Gemmatimonadota bacterium]